MGLSIKWDITYKCNLMCNHCINGNFLNNNEDEISLDDIKKIITKINDNIKIEYIHFLGGEPLTRTDFIDILEFLNLNKIKFGFNSNGLLLTEKNVNRLCKLNYLDNIVLSLEGPNERINDEIRGKNIFNTVLCRINLLNAYKSQNPSCKTKININCVVTTENYEYIIDLIKLCEKNNVDELSLLEFIEDGNGVGKNFVLDSEQFLEVVRVVAEYYTHNKNSMKIIPKFARPLAKDYVNMCFNLDFPPIYHGCGAAATSLFLDNKGYIYPCDRNRKYCNNKYSLLEHNFFDIWNNDDFTLPFTRYYGDKIYKNMQPCNDCTYLCNECFPCHLGVFPDELSVMNRCQLLKNRMQKQEGILHD